MTWDERGIVVRWAPQIWDGTLLTLARSSPSRLSSAWYLPFRWGWRAPQGIGMCAALPYNYHLSSSAATPLLLQLVSGLLRSVAI